MPASSASDGVGAVVSFQGLVPTILRDGPGVGVWLLGFQVTKNLLKDRPGRPHPQAPLGFFDLLIAGCVAGFAFWTGLYDTYDGLQGYQVLLSDHACFPYVYNGAPIVALPLDTIKSVIQVQAPQGHNRQGMCATATRLIKNEGGVRRLYRGWQSAFVRALPGSATTLAVFDLIKDKI